MLSPDLQALALYIALLWLSSSASAFLTDRLLYHCLVCHSCFFHTLMECYPSYTRIPTAMRLEHIEHSSFTAPSIKMYSLYFSVCVCVYLAFNISDCIKDELAHTHKRTRSYTPPSNVLTVHSQLLMESNQQSVNQTLGFPCRVLV